MFVYIVNRTPRVIWLCLAEDPKVFEEDSFEYVQSLIVDKTLTLN